MPEIHNNKALRDNRKLLRNNSTSAEAVLWGCLKNSQLKGRKFRRQHSIHTYVIDFYCPKELLAIELDGAQHFTKEGKENDGLRTKDLAALNIKVIRFENRLIFENIKQVLAEIESNFKAKN
jgi:very-short-patch-repair endonuclease